MRPSANTEIQRPDLATLMWEHSVARSQADFIGLKLLPLFPTPLQSADYPIIPLNAFLKIPETKRATHGSYNRTSWEFKTGTYVCSEDGLEEPLYEDEVRQHRRFFDAEVVAAERATDMLLRSQEKRSADVINDAANAGGSADALIPWVDKSCTPLEDIIAAKKIMFYTYSVEPNKLVLTKDVFDQLMLSTILQDKKGYNVQSHLLDGIDMQRRMLAAYLGIGEVLIARSIMDIAAEGKPSDLKPIWDDNVALLVKAAEGTSRNLREPILGRTFLWTLDSPNNITVDQYPEPQTRANIYRVRHSTGSKIIYAGALYRITGIAS